MGEISPPGHGVGAGIEDEIVLLIILDEPVPGVGEGKRVGGGEAPVEPRAERVAVLVDGEDVVLVGGEVGVIDGGL